MPRLATPIWRPGIPTASGLHAPTCDIVADCSFAENPHGMATRRIRAVASQTPRSRPASPRPSCPKNATLNAPFLAVRHDFDISQYYCGVAYRYCCKIICVSALIWCTCTDVAAVSGVLSDCDIWFYTVCWLCIDRCVTILQSQMAVFGSGSMCMTLILCP